MTSFWSLNVNGLQFILISNTEISNGTQVSLKPILVVHPVLIYCEAPVLLPVNPNLPHHPLRALMCVAGHLWTPAGLPVAPGPGTPASEAAQSGVPVHASCQGASAIHSCSHSGLMGLLGRLVTCWLIVSCFHSLTIIAFIICKDDQEAIFSPHQTMLSSPSLIM